MLLASLHPPFAVAGVITPTIRRVSATWRWLVESPVEISSVSGGGVAAEEHAESLAAADVDDGASSRALGRASDYSALCG